VLQEIPLQDAGLNSQLHLLFRHETFYRRSETCRALRGGEPVAWKIYWSSTGLCNL